MATRQRGTEARLTRPVLPNAAVQVRYDSRMQALIDEMHKSYMYWLKATYRDAPPLLAQDASPVQTAEKRLKELAKRWQKKFNEMAPRVAEQFANEVAKSSDVAFQNALRDAGFAVKFTLTPEIKDALRARIAENVELIKSLPEQYSKSVQGAIMRSYSAGGDLSSVVKEIRKYHGITARRANFIARDQTNKANATEVRTRRLELGLNKAIWKHSHAGKTPRPSHLAADGKEFDVAKGKYLDGKWVQPGEEPNCRCYSRTILPF